MQLCGREFSAAMIARIAKTLMADPSLSRRSLSLLVCQWMQWRATNGKWKEVSCRKALLELHHRKLITLPAATKSCFTRSRRKTPTKRQIDIAEVQCTLKALGEMSIVAISSRYSKASGIWNALLERYHYLGKGPLCGAQIRYLVESSRYGWVGALAFSAAQWRLKKRDKYIGWTEAARRANLNRVVCNSRFLIPPNVRVPHLASHVLSLCMSRLVKDWTERYGYAPVLVETFVDPSRFKGTCYRAADFFAQPGELIPQASNGSAAKTKAAYRFFENANVDMQTLLRPHIESTLDRLRSLPVVLAVQDSTTLTYTSHPPEGAGPINTSQNSTVGLMVHDTMAFTPDGTPLGLLNVQCWGRNPEQAGKGQRRHQLPIEEKESIKWLMSYRAVADAQKLCPDTMLVSIGDREADVYELFHEATQDPRGPKLLIRAERTRNRKVEQEGLWPRMNAEPVAGLIEVAVARRGLRPARTAKLQVRFASVVLSPPGNSMLPALRIWAVYAREVDYRADVKEPIDWMLLTTVKTETFEDACQRLSWYGRRWRIEVYHRILKSGCRIEDRRLDDTDSLEPCLAIDIVVAWQVYWMTMVGREKPDTACDEILSEEEWHVSSAWATGKIPNTAPSAQQAMRWIGKMGGWLARGKQDNPGTTCMWRGLGRLPTMAQGYLLALRVHGVRAGP